MLTITSYTAEYIKDPFGILAGKRYEFKLDLDIPEEDELYTTQGVYARIIIKAEGETVNLVSSDLVERGTDKLLEFDLEEDEEAELAAFCREHLPEE